MQTSTDSTTTVTGLHPKLVRNQPVFITQMGEANDGARKEIRKQQVHSRLKKHKTEEVMPAEKVCNARTISKTVNELAR